MFRSSTRGSRPYLVIWVTAMVVILVLGFILVPKLAPAHPTGSPSPNLALAPFNGHPTKLNDSVAGYSVIGPNQSVYAIHDSFVLPTVSNCQASNNSTWGEIADGVVMNIADPNVTGQSGAGALLSCFNGTISYSAYVELPNIGIEIIDQIHVYPGDVFDLSVAYGAGAGRGSLTWNLSIGQQIFSDRENYASRESTGSGACVVDKIVIANEVSGKVVAVFNDPKFSVAAIGQDYTGDPGTCDLAEKNATGTLITAPIGTFDTSSWAHDGTTLYESSMGVLNQTGVYVPGATPTALSTDGSSFKVSWKTYGDGEK
ncbi:MAG: G1 family glutamic endopeptidase [Thermoplasmata archaeon]